MHRLVEPVLLSLLTRGDGHYGYELMEHANREALTDSEIDAAVVYRTLRTLEEAGCVVSEWQPGAGGPHRRMYEITDVGRQHLQDWLTVLARHADRLEGFVARHAPG
jgi:DNA-binding PadR family transcriptional regulator